MAWEFESPPGHQSASRSRRRKSAALLRSRARPACPGRAAASLSAPGIASLRGVSRRQGRAVPRAGRRAETCRAVFRPSGAVWGRVFCRRKGGPGSGKERSVRGDVSRLFRALFSPPPVHVFPPFPFREGGFFCTRKGEAPRGQARPAAEAVFFTLKKVQ